jgi:3-methyladenine DNA glycosylase/8-oxoguanine DNA glycosylase
MQEYVFRPRGPYSLAATARHAGDATRTFYDRTLVAALEVEGTVQVVAARQRPEGTVVVAAPSEAAAERLRWVLALGDDHSEFLRRFADDPLLGEAVRRIRGLRPLRVATVAQALLRALCGQLITSAEARRLERRVIAAVSPVVPDTRLRTPPTAAAFARLGPADLRRIGLHARRGATLVRLCRSLELERLHGVSTEAAARRLERERGLGPWSAGVVCLEGLGRYERGLVGDLGLIKLVSALRGRWADAGETAELLEPYGEWAGLASVYLLGGWARGLVPVPAVRAA